MKQEISGDPAIRIGFVLQALGSRTVAEIEVTRQACVSSPMRIAVPHLIIFAGPLVPLLQKFAIVLPRGFLRLVDRQDHRGEEWRLRARQKIGAVGVQDRAIVFDLEEEVFDDAAREVEPLVFHQSAHDEVRVPAVHFVETAAGDDVAVREIKQSGRGDVGRDLSRPRDGHRKLLDLDVAALLHLTDRRGHRESCGQIQNRLFNQLGIDDCVAVGHGAGERIPAGVDVFENRG